MEDKDLPSDSDSSDEDYIPKGAENEAVSEDESGHDSSEHEASEGEDVGDEKKRKKTPSRKRSRKKLKSQQVEEKKEEPKKEEIPEMSAEDKKQRADALWADFLKDCDPPVRKKCESSNSTEQKSENVEKQQQQQSKVKIVEEYEFAGEKVLVEKEIPTTNGVSNANSIGQPSKSSIPPPTRGRGRGRGAATGGIASILGQIGKKSKLSTLEKSKLDWDSFKKDEGIKEDIERHNKGKNGYLERQDFLERADLRQFEIEKNLRASKRTSLR